MQNAAGVFYRKWRGGMGLVFLGVESGLSKDSVFML